MKIFDVSMIINKDIQVYKNKEDKKPTFTNVSNFNTGSSYETKLSFNLHTGTHMDFPLHMIESSENSDSLVLTDLIRQVKVFDLSHLEDAITKEDLVEFNINEGDFILFKTKNSFSEEFDFRFIYLREDAATFLKSKKIKGVGIDALGIERDQKGHPTHKILLGQKIIIIEGLRLKDVKNGSYMMYALPLKISGVEALPMRIILTQE